MCGRGIMGVETTGAWLEPKCVPPVFACTYPQIYIDTCVHIHSPELWHPDPRSLTLLCWGVAEVLSRVCGVAEVLSRVCGEAEGMETCPAQALPSLPHAALCHSSPLESCLVPVAGVLQWLLCGGVWTL